MITFLTKRCVTTNYNYNANYSGESDKEQSPNKCAIPRDISTPTGTPTATKRKPSGTKGKIL